MNDKLIVKQKTYVGEDRQEKDILDYYGVPALFDNIIQRDKDMIFNSDNIQIGMEVIGECFNAHDLKDYVVEIPEHLKELLKSGKAVFDGSKVVPGNFAANIRMDGKIVGQATLKETADFGKIGDSLQNLAMFATMQSILGRLETIEEKLEGIEMGQMNDRIGKVIGAFKHAAIQYLNIDNKDKLFEVVNGALQSMQVGLGQIHLQIEEYRKMLQIAPCTTPEVIKFGIKNIRKNWIADLRKTYIKYMWSLQTYLRLILTADSLLFLTGNINGIEANHKHISEYIEDYIDEDFEKRMSCLMNGNNIHQIGQLRDLNRYIGRELLGYAGKQLQIEFSESNNLKLNNNEYKSN